MKKTILLLGLLLGSKVWALSCSAPVTLFEFGLHDPHLVQSLDLTDEGEAAVLVLTPKCIKAFTRDGEKNWSGSCVVSEHENTIANPMIRFTADGVLCSSWLDIKEDKKETICNASRRVGKEGWISPIGVVKPEDFRSCHSWINPQGDLLAVGYRVEGSSFSVKSMRYRSQTAQKLVHTHSSIPQNTTLISTVSNKDGKGVLFWTEQQPGWFGSTRVLQGTWLAGNGSSFPAVKICDLDPRYSYNLFTAAMNQKDDLALIWEQWSSHTYKIQAAISFDRGEAEVIDLNLSADQYFDRKIAIDDEGNVLAVWSQEHGKRPAIFAAYKPRDKDWASLGLLSDPAKSSYSCQTTPDGKGNFILVWSEFCKSENTIFGVTFSTKTLSLSKAILSPPGQKCWKPQFLFNSKGEGLLTWVSKADAQFCIQAAELISNEEMK